MNAKDRKYQIWQRNPLSIDLWTKEVYIQKMEYIHNNPVRAELCIYPEQYKYSSAKILLNRRRRIWNAYTVGCIIQLLVQLMPQGYWNTNNGRIKRDLELTIRKF